MKTIVKKKVTRKDHPGRRVMQIFLVPRSDVFECSRLKSLVSSVPRVLKPAASAFVSNISGTASTICIPATLAIASAQEWRYRQIHIAEKIRASGKSWGVTRAAAEAKKRADKRFAEEMGAKEPLEHLGITASDFLLQVHQDPLVAAAGAELLRQGVVLIWGALEALCRDVLETTVNTHPNFGKQLLDSPDGRKIFQIKAIDLDTLAKFDFNISDRLGSLLVQYNDLSKLTAIKGIFDVFSQSNPTLRTALASKQLWVLNQRRHLIVHNRGVVDQRYIENTGEKTPIGHKIVLRPKEIEDYICLVQDVGADILDAIKSIWDKHPGT